MHNATAVRPHLTNDNAAHIRYRFGVAHQKQKRILTAMPETHEWSKRKTTWHAALLHEDAQAKLLPPATMPSPTAGAISTVWPLKDGHAGKPDLHADVAKTWQICDGKRSVDRPVIPI